MQFVQARPVTAKASSTQPASTLTDPPPTIRRFPRIESKLKARTIREAALGRRQGCLKASSLWLHVAAHEEGRPVVYVRGGSGHVLRRRLLLPHLRESRLVAGIFDALLVLSCHAQP